MRLALVLIALLLGALPSRAVAQERGGAPSIDKNRAAERHAQAALVLAQKGQNAEAAGEWALAYALTPKPPLLLRVAIALEAAGQPQRAAVLLRRFLSLTPPGAPERAAARRRLAVLDRTPALRAERERGRGRDQGTLAQRLADEASQEGAAAYEEQRFLWALRSHALANALVPDRTLFTNLGYAAERSGALEDALLFLENAPLAALPKEVAQATQQHAETLRSSLAQAAVASQPSAPPPTRSAPLQATPTPLAPPVVAQAAPTPPRAPPSALPPPIARVRSAPYLEAAAGLSLAFHRLSFSGADSGCSFLASVPAGPPGSPPPALSPYRPGRCPGYGVAGLPGLRLALAVYPLAALSSRWLQGLGVTAALDLWPRMPLCAAADMDVRCAAELRFFVGLRYRVPRFGPQERLTLAVSARYGLQRFDLQREQMGTTLDLGLPPFQAQLLDLGVELDARLWSRGRLALFAGLEGAVLQPLLLRGLAQGEADPLGGYGASGLETGLRVAGTALALRRGGLQVALRGSYQRLSASLAPASPSDGAAARPDSDPRPRFLAARMVFDQGELLLEVSQRY